MSDLKAKLDRVNHRTAYWRARAAEVKQQSCRKKTELLHEVKKLQDEVCCLDLDCAELKDCLESVMETDEISTFEGGRYNDDVRACVYELLSLNVGVRNVAPIIRCVLGNIAHRSVGRLPSHGLTCQMIIESLTVLQAQLGEKLSVTDGYSTLQTDGTTKFGDHFATYDIRIPDKTTYCLGLRHVFSGSAQTTLDILKEILSDIDNIQMSLGKDAVSARIVALLKNTMSDRHAAEKRFNVMLYDYRAEVLPTVAQNWDELSEIEKEHLTRMNNFFCGLHFIVGLADTAEEVLKLWESEHHSVILTPEHRD